MEGSRRDGSTRGPSGRRSSQSLNEVRHTVSPTAGGERTPAVGGRPRGTAWPGLNGRLCETPVRGCVGDFYGNSFAGWVNGSREGSRIIFSQHSTVGAKLLPLRLTPEPGGVAFGRSGEPSRTLLLCRERSWTDTDRVASIPCPEGRSGWTSAISLLGPNSPASGHQAPGEVRPHLKKGINATRYQQDATPPPVPGSGASHRQRETGTNAARLGRNNPTALGAKLPGIRDLTANGGKSSAAFCFRRNYSHPQDGAGETGGLRWSAVDRERSRLWGKAGGIAPGRRGGA